MANFLFDYVWHWTLTQISGYDKQSIKLMTALSVNICKVENFVRDLRTIDLRYYTSLKIETH